MARLCAGPYHVQRGEEDAEREREQDEEQRESFGVLDLVAWRRIGGLLVALVFVDDLRPIADEVLNFWLVLFFVEFLPVRDCWRACGRRGVT